VEAAKSLYKRGIVYKAEVFNTKLFTPRVLLTRYFKYYKYGHQARFYKVPA
jgi:hypothetical protein